MNRRLLGLWAIAASLTLLAMSLPAAALAAGCGCTPAPPAACCKQPTPPAPPTQPCCGSGGNNIIVPGVNVYVAPSVIVEASASAQVNASASATGSASGSGYGSGFGYGSGSGSGTGAGIGSAAANIINYGGGGGSSFFESGGSSGTIQALNVDSGASQRSAYQASRSKVRIVVIQAFCLDDKDVPHPASQVTPDRELPESYAGEVYRCIAGTRMQWTLADYLGKVDFSQGQTTTCNKSEALVMTHAPGQPLGYLQCMAQKPARDCNERSLLRRFGAGVKIIKIITTETYTAYREEQTRTASSGGFESMTIDGGVGGVAH
ncbi:MAG TPA: hypothetical protein VMU59_03990 [Caulobacteraceae bacterium]|nr:hypothetical protein [Caulobacteraceae bacterium]